jgi:hypothetical protein
LIEADGGRREFYMIKHSPESLDQFLAKLRFRLRSTHRHRARAVTWTSDLCPTQV